MSIAKPAALQELFETVVGSGMFKAYSDLQESDVYVIAVPTPFKEGYDEKIADLSYVEVRQGQ